MKNTPKALPKLIKSPLFWAICSLFATEQAFALGCLLEPSQVSEVAAISQGVATEVKVDRGAVVKRGQVLAVLAADVERANLAAAKQRAFSESEIDAAAAARDLAKMKMRKSYDLLNLGHGTQLELDQTRHEFEISEHKHQSAKDALQVAKKEANVAQRYLEQRMVRSPIDGVIAERQLNLGERTDGKALFRIVGLQKLKAELVLPAAQFGTIREGMTATITPEAIGAKNAFGQITQVDQFVDAASGTFRARVMLNNFDRQIPAGVKCTASFAETKAASNNVVPAQKVGSNSKPAIALASNKVKPAKKAAVKPVAASIKPRSTAPATQAKLSKPAVPQS
jgi:membrane fusion protein, heavy metal efflux system